MEHASVRIVVNTGVRIRGTLLNKEGDPARGAEVLLLSGWTVPYDEVDIGSICARGDGICMIGSKQTNRARVWVLGSSRTDERGCFAVRVRSEGKGLVVAWIPGHAPVRMPVDVARFGEHDLGVVQAVGSEHSSRVRFVLDGEPLVRHRLLMVDVSSDVGQFTVPIRNLDESGSVPGDWFEVGRKYFFHVFGASLPREGLRGSLTWDGRETIDVGTDLEE